MKVLRLEFELKTIQETQERLSVITDEHTFITDE
jgi:hypothetical protein